MNDAGRCDVVLVACNPNAVNAELTGLFQRESQHQSAVAPAALGGSDAIADVAAEIEQVGGEPMTDITSAQDPPTAHEPGTSGEFVKTN